MRPLVLRVALCLRDVLRCLRCLRVFLLRPPENEEFPDPELLDPKFGIDIPELPLDPRFGIDIPELPLDPRLGRIDEELLDPKLGRMDEELLRGEPIEGI